MSVHSLVLEKQLFTQLVMTACYRCFHNLAWLAARIHQNLSDQVLSAIVCLVDCLLLLHI